MRRLCALTLAGALIVASCSSEGDATTTVYPAPTAAATTDLVATTAGPSATTAAPTTTVPATTTGVPATTTTLPAGPGVLAMIRLVFTPSPYVLVTNVGGSPIELGDHWMCRRPSYKQLPQFTMAPGDTVAVGIGDVPPPADLTGLAGTVDIGSVFGAITTTDGELGLFTAPTFDAAEAIVDYVEWGSADHGRESVAVAAGIWTAGAFVAVPGEALALTSSGLPEAGFEDWSAEVGG